MDDQPTPHELLFINLGDLQLGYKQNITEDSEQKLGEKQMIWALVGGRRSSGNCLGVENKDVDPLVGQQLS